MIASCYTVAFQGIDVITVEVQVQIEKTSWGKGYTVVGLPDASIKESIQRIRCAIPASGIEFPYENLTINLAPASLNKEGTHYDLAIAIATLAGMGIIQPKQLSNLIIMGEITLKGNIIPVEGVFAASLIAKQKGFGIVCPKGNKHEAVGARNPNIIAGDTIIDIVQQLSNPQENISENDNIQPSYVPQKPYPDMADIKGQQPAKRALEIAAAGNHNLLMSGPPGSGKSMLAQRLPGLLPPLSERDIFDINLIASISGIHKGKELIRNIPFRTPHHSCSMVAMVGGGKYAKPGEITLAHKGILFLDELPEFPRQVIESLRQPLESGTITISRAQLHITYPADFQLVAAMNPCKCGYIGDSSRACHRVPICAKQYQSKLSGPILDRIDIMIDVPEVPLHDIHTLPPGESSSSIRERVRKARQIQIERYVSCDHKTNAQTPFKILEQSLTLDNETKLFLENAMRTWKLSMRGYTRILRVARTIADLDGSSTVQKKHLAEAFSYRPVSLV